MTIKEFFDKYGAVIVALAALAGSGTAVKITELFKEYEHLSVIHGAAAFLTIIIMYLLSQVARLPHIAKRLCEHSDELHELSKEYGKMVSVNERLVKLLEKLETSLEKNSDKQSAIGLRLARLEGYEEGKEGRRGSS